METHINLRKKHSISNNSMSKCENGTPDPTVLVRLYIISISARSETEKT